MTDSILERWAKRFLKAAGADDFVTFRKHLERLGAPGTPHDAALATTYMLSMYYGFVAIDGRLSDFRRLLAKQTYNPRHATGVRYVATFGICHFATARILVEDIAEIDLADLNGVMWNQYKVAGYSTLWISRVDGRPLGRRELDRLEAAVENDFRFDYSEDELALTFFPESRYLKVDVVELDEDDA
jgi:hypothetical protein